MKNIALIGAGYWGKNLARILFEINVLHSICDIDNNKLDEFILKYPEIKTSNSYEDILKDTSVQSVVIATSSAYHYAIAKKALEEGKDVFVEKPMALSTGEAKELVKLANEKKKILMVGHILQYHPAFIKLREILSEGKLGKIEYIYSNRLNIGKLRTEENILWSFAPHDISIILKLINEEPVKISASGGAYINNNIYDTTLTSLEFNNGVKSHIFVSWLHPYKEQKLVVIGSDGMIVFDDLTEEKLFLYPHKIEWKEGKIPVAHKADCEIISFEKGEPLKLELEHFLNCIETREHPITDGEEGLRVLNVLEAAEKSLSNNTNKTDNKKTILYFSHESSYIDEGVEIGEGTKIWHFSHILKNSRIGKNCVIGQNASIGPNIIMGNNCKVQNNVSIYEKVTLEDDVFCGPSCVFTNVYNPRSFVERKHEFRTTLVKKGASIGANATVICGTTIGKYAFVGSGAVVKKDVPDYAIVAGVPARQVGWICKCGVSLKEQDENKNFICKNCSNIYKIENNLLLPVEEKI